MKLVRVADGAGVAGALFAAFCCAGAPVIVGALGAVGLAFLRNDAILLPLLALSLALAWWGFAKGRSQHGAAGPLVLGVLGGLGLVAGILTTKWLIGVGSVLLVGATVWNVAARHGSPRFRRATVSGGGDTCDHC